MKRLPAPAAALFRCIASALSPPGRGAALVVLMYHRVLERADPMLPDEPDAGRFAAQMDVVRDLFRIVDLHDGITALQAGALPARCAAITFDDGYSNNASIAAPILSARSMTATFFVATGFLDGGAMWNDIVIEAFRQAPASFDLSPLGLGSLDLAPAGARRLAAESVLERLKYMSPDARLESARAIEASAGIRNPRSLMMSESDIRRLAGMGMAIGAHSVSHPILARLPEDSARREICDSKDVLEQITAGKVTTFAYPNGRPARDYGRRDIELVRAAGFSTAVSTAWGSATRNCDRLQVPRVAPWDRSASRFAARLLRAQSQRSPARV